jgi:hypothetical protein
MESVKILKKDLASGSKDKSIGFVDSNGKLVHHMKEAHQ